MTPVQKGLIWSAVALVVFGVLLLAYDVELSWAVIALGVLFVVMPFVRQVGGAAARDAGVRARQRREDRA